MHPNLPVIDAGREERAGGKRARALSLMHERLSLMHKRSHALFLMHGQKKKMMAERERARARAQACL
jgi:hypothetical protein